MKLVYHCPNISIDRMFMNTENSQINEPHKFVINLLQTLGKHLAYQNS